MSAMTQGAKRRCGGAGGRWLRLGAHGADNRHHRRTGATR